MCCERWSPPIGLARALPCSRSSARQRLTLAALTLKRLLTSRWLSPDATAARTRTRRSSESGVDMAANLLAEDHLNHAHASLESSNRFKPLGSRSSPVRLLE